MAYKDRLCKICNKLFTPSNSNINCCSDECSHAYRIQYKKTWYKQNSKRIYLKYLLYRKKHAAGRQIALRLIKKLNIPRVCEICQSEYVIDIHHKDKNTSNNNLNNLQILCRYCHVKIHGNGFQGRDI